MLPIILGVLAPIVEEIIFRGILPLKIFKGYEGWGYIVGGLLFALFHGPTNIVSFVIYAVSSVILTLLAYRTRRLEVSIAVHCSSPHADKVFLVFTRWDRVYAGWMRQDLVLRSKRSTSILGNHKARVESWVFDQEGWELAQLAVN